MTMRTRTSAQNARLRSRVTSAVSGLLRLSLIAIATAGPATSPVYGQVVDSALPVISRADSIFAAGLQSFEAGDYGRARDEFDQAVTGFPMHRSTTAAEIMKAKSAYRAQDYRRAARELRRFIDRYPTSSFIADAQRSLALAEDALSRRSGSGFEIGIVLSLEDDEVTESQNLFNGIRMAVDEANRSGRYGPVRMVFRDTHSTPTGAAAAVRDVAREGVSFVVGALFSDQAIAAARAADEERVVFVAPLATDDRVTTGRDYAFQANPSIETRGRAMARFAVYGLRLDSLGVIGKNDPSGISERLTDAFVQEASTLGAKINLVSVLQDDNDYVRLSETLTADTLGHVQALYVPVASEEPQRAIGALLSSLDRMGARVRLLGNSSWHELPMVAAASRYTSTYSNDFYIDPDNEAVQAFSERYEASTGDEPGRLAFTGYDVMNFLLPLAAADDGDNLRDAILFEGPFRGLATRIEFNGTHINEALFFHRYRDGELTLIR